MSDLLNWFGRIVLYFLFKYALFQMYPAWRMHFRIALYTIVVLWVYNEFPALQRAVRRWLKVEPDGSDDKDDWAELKDFVTLVVGVMVVLIGSTLGQTFLENIRGPEVRSLIVDGFFDILIGTLQLLGFMIPPIMFIRYGWALLRGKRFFKVEDADKQQPVEDTDEQQP